MGNIVIPQVLDFTTNTTRRFGVGDLINGGEVDQSLSTVGNATLTAALLSGTILRRLGTQVAAFSDTTDTSANIINKILGNQYLGTEAAFGRNGGHLAVPDGLSWRVRYINGTGYQVNFVAGTGVTWTGFTGLASGFACDLVVSITCGAVAQVLTGNTTSGSKTITGLSENMLGKLQVGMLVSGTGIQAGSKIEAIVPGVGALISLTASATGSNISLTFNPTVAIIQIG
jgi:hypothetical protein